MSERMTTETPVAEEVQTENVTTGEHYSLMKIDAGMLGDIFYYNVPTFTILAKTKDDLNKLNEEFSVLFSKYTEDIVVGTSHETSLILSLNQAAADLSVQSDIINTLREKIYELTGSYDSAGNFEGAEDVSA